MANLKVKKRDGNTEDFSYDKLVVSIGKAGVPETNAEEVASQVATWTQNTAGESGEIGSSEIRDKIIELLSNDFPVEAENYRAYKKG